MDLVHPMGKKYDRPQFNKRLTKIVKNIDVLPSFCFRLTTESLDASLKILMKITYKYSQKKKNGNTGKLIVPIHKIPELNHLLAVRLAKSTEVQKQYDLLQLS